MVNFAPVFGAAALFASLVSAAPRPDSAIGDEVAVSAPNGVILSDTAELASRQAATAAASSTAAYAAATTTAASGSGYGGYGGYGSGGYDSSSSSSSANNYGYDTTSTAIADATSAGSYYTTTSSAMSSQMTYGSGSSNWGGSGYDSCVQQCVASYGAPPATWTPPPSKTDSSSGNGVTHTVIVAPTQGVLRYVPFAVNASVGDTVHFVWMANNHTVTKSSELELCNKTSNAPFISGTHDKGFTFDQVVNDTNPTFYYCGTPNHCQKGMFGMINPPNAAGAATSVQQMMPSLVANSSDMSAMWSYMNNMTTGNLAATQWGNNLDLAKMPEWSHATFMENVMYARTFFAANPEILSADGTVDMSANGNPIKFPIDITTALSATSNSAPASSSASSAASASSASATPASTDAASRTANSASSTFASSALVTVAVLAATFLSL